MVAVFIVNKSVPRKNKRIVAAKHPCCFAFFPVTNEVKICGSAIIFASNVNRKVIEMIAVVGIMKRNGIIEAAIFCVTFVIFKLENSNREPSVNFQDFIALFDAGSIAFKIFTHVDFITLKLHALVI